MNDLPRIVALLLAACLLPASAPAQPADAADRNDGSQTPAPVADDAAPSPSAAAPDPAASVPRARDDEASLREINALRNALVEAFNKRDMETMLAQLHPDVVVTWPNAEVSHGREGVRQYVNQKMSDVVASLEYKPEIEGRKLYGNISVSYGKLNDHFKLKDGTEFDMNSRFSAMLVRGGDGKWLVTGFHASGNLFDNPIQDIVQRRTTYWAGGIAAVAGLLIGYLLAKLLGRRRARATP